MWTFDDSLLKSWKIICWKNLPLSSRADHFYDIWHPADPRADRAALFWLIHKQSKHHELKPDKLPTNRKNFLVIFLSEFLFVYSLNCLLKKASQISGHELASSNLG